LCRTVPNRAPPHHLDGAPHPPEARRGWVGALLCIALESARVRPARHARPSRGEMSSCRRSRWQLDSETPRGWHQGVSGEEWSPLGGDRDAVCEHSTTPSERRVPGTRFPCSPTHPCSYFALGKTHRQAGQAHASARPEIPPGRAFEEAPRHVTNGESRSVAPARIPECPGGRGVALDDQTGGSKCKKTRECHKWSRVPIRASICDGWRTLRSPILCPSHASVRRDHEFDYWNIANWNRISE
jgi:hypothetical protein